MSTFESFSLDPALLGLLKEIGYEKPTPVQELGIPIILNNSDLIACAQTGTGKTGTFLIPSLHKIATSKKVGAPRLLVLVPTRELAMQITKEAKKYSKRLPSIKTVCIYGGVPYPQQKKELRRPFDILVATPGRLMDHMDRGIVDLSKIDTLVLDEADRMLDMGFLDPVEFISNACPESRQTLLFSATLDKKILQISKNLQKDPVEIKLEPDDHTKSNIQQKILFTDDLKHKMRLLDHYLENEISGQAIVFTATKRHADELSDTLRDRGEKVDALHGDMNQRQRSRAVSRLRNNQTRILVATDVAARGIDIPDLQFVVNLDLPFKAEDYIHRIGRTGRAGAKGDAVTFVSRQDRSMMERIEKLVGKPIDVHTIEGLEPKLKTLPPKKSQKSFRKGPSKRGRQFSKEPLNKTFSRDSKQKRRRG